MPIVGPSRAAPIGPEILSLGRVVVPLQVNDALYIPPDPRDNGAARAGLLLALGAPPSLQFPRRIAIDVDALYIPPDPRDDGAARAGPIGPTPSGLAMGAPSRGFLQPVRSQALYTIAGVTRDATGAVLGSCEVFLHLAAGEGRRASSMMSDATTGAYSFMVGDTTTPYFVVSYKDGTPVFGTTKRTLFGV